MESKRTTDSEPAVPIALRPVSNGLPLAKSMAIVYILRSLSYMNETRNIQQKVSDIYECGY